MKIFIAQHKDYPDHVVCSQDPFMQDPNGYIHFPAQPRRGAHVDGTDLPNTLNPGEGALIDVRFSPAKGYTPVKFGGCEYGIRQVLGRLPRIEGTTWVIYAKTLKRELPAKPAWF